LAKSRQIVNAVEFCFASGNPLFEIFLSLFLLKDSSS
jgi:hypothetical protein